MRRRPSWLELKTRRVAVEHVVPRVLRAGVKLAQTFETRMRRTTAIARYARGAGLELGAAATPAAIPPDLAVTYVDKYGLDTHTSDPELQGLPIRAPDVLDDAETLASFEDGSQDFVLAFSVMEHVQSPLSMILACTRVLRPGGVFIFTVPDKRFYGPDRERPLTSFEHLVRDHEEGSHLSIADHYREIGVIRHGLERESLDAFVEERVASGGHTHFHVWDANTFVEHMVSARRYANDAFSLVETASYEHEVLVVGEAGPGDARVGGSR